MEFHLDGFATRCARLEQRLGGIGQEFGMDWRLTDADRRKRVTLFASRHDHCLLDLLWRWRTRELDMDVVCVVSNHPDHAPDVAAFGVAYHHIPVTPVTKLRAEHAQLELLAGKVDLVVLARYMQILSSEFLQQIGAPVINIHHSFLPAFAGADPYTRAYERGVKLIGATAHYATEDLDEGPIIEQETRSASGFQGKRLKGFEPSTFCMASRRSSQLSYSRRGRQYSRGFRGGQASARPSTSSSNQARLPPASVRSRPHPSASRSTSSRP
jgi:formyltetrahydrofolate deformylase